MRRVETDIQQNLKKELQIIDKCVEIDVLNVLETLVIKMANDLNEGFTVNLNHGSGFKAVYSRDESKRKYKLIEIWVDQMVARELISGSYRTSGGEVTIEVIRECVTDFINCRVFLNGNLVYSYTNPFDEIALSTDGYSNAFQVDNVRDRERLLSAYSHGGDCLAFAAKMLNDFKGSNPDISITVRMFEQVKENDSNVSVRWNKQ